MYKCIYCCEKFEYPIYNDGGLAWSKICPDCNEKYGSSKDNDNPKEEEPILEE